MSKKCRLYKIQTHESMKDRISGHGHTSLHIKDPMKGLLGCCIRPLSLLYVYIYLKWFHSLKTESVLSYLPSPSENLIYKVESNYKYFGLKPVISCHPQIIWNDVCRPCTKRVVKFSHFWRNVFQEGNRKYINGNIYMNT